MLVRFVEVKHLYILFKLYKDILFNQSSKTILHKKIQNLHKSPKPLKIGHIVSARTSVCFFIFPSR